MLPILSRRARIPIFFVFCTDATPLGMSSLGGVTVPEIRGILLRSKWAAGKTVRAGLALEGAYLNRYVTDDQRGRRPIFIATLWAGASWLFSALLVRPV
jgi:hypothetical protein